MTYDVTLLQVAQEATPGSGSRSPGPNNHIAAAQFLVTAVTEAQDSSFGATEVTGSDGKTYFPRVGLSVAEGPSFPSVGGLPGTFALQPGSSLRAWVSFAVADGVTISRVQWQAGLGFGSKVSGLTSDTCRWLVP
jgi:hypothetical protein